MAKKYVSPDTLKAFMVIVKTGLAGKLNVTDVVNDLTTADETKPLSAAQGKALKDLIDAAGTADVDAKTLEGLSAADFVKAANIVTDLAAYTPADGDGKVAAAALVKTLQATVTTLQTTVEGKLDGTDILTDWAKLDAEKTQLVAAALVKAIKDTADNAASKVAELEEKITTETAKYVPLTQKGAANGVAPLDAEGKVASDYLPSYVDDVIEGYLADGKLYEEEAHTTEITGEKGKIYVDLGSANNQCYRWSGSAFVEVSSNDMVEISDDEVEAMWNEVVAANA